MEEGQEQKRTKKEWVGVAWKKNREGGREGGNGNKMGGNCWRVRMKRGGGG